jgi:hypothetical protein
MKQLLLTLLLQGFFIGIAVCQTYNPLIRPNTFWNENFGDGMQFCRATGGERLYFQGDTMINGFQYEILRGHPLYSLSTPYCPPYAADFSTSTIVNYMREDTATKQVFVYTDDFNGNHPSGGYLLFDFSLNVGDTINGMIVNTIDSVTLLDGATRKRWNFDPSGNFFYIEGIGGKQGMYHPFQRVGLGYWTEPLCISENGSEIYGDRCNDNVLSVKEPPPTVSFEIYPNPAQDGITVELPSDFNHQSAIISIFNAQGQVLQEQKSIVDNTVILSLLDYPAGMYFIQVRDEDKIIGIEKFVVE